jgi:hypothetical protein
MPLKWKDVEEFLARTLDDYHSQLTFFSQPGHLLVVQQKKQLPRKNRGLGMDGMGNIPKHQKKTLMQQQGQLVMDGNRQTWVATFF